MTAIQFLLNLRDGYEHKRKELIMEAKIANKISHTIEFAVIYQKENLIGEFIMKIDDAIQIMNETGKVTQ